VLLRPLRLTNGDNLEGPGVADTTAVWVALAPSIVAVLAILVNGLWTRRQLKMQQEEHVPDRYSQALDQLAGNEIQRVGAVYALEGIMRDSERYHTAIVDVLAAFIRVSARARASTDGEAAEAEPTVEVQTTLTVLGARPWRPQIESSPIRLSGRGTPVDLRDTLLRGAHLECVRLRWARLENIHWEGTHLEGARLRGANLENADLEGAYLQGASLALASLTGTRLHGAHLAGVEGHPQLTPEQLRDAHCRPDDRTCSEGPSDNPCARFAPWND